MSERAKVTAKTPGTNRENSASQANKTNSSPSINSPIEQILLLQRTVGNQAVERLLKSGVIQAKLTIGKPGDIYEQEADRVAEQVMRMPYPRINEKASVSTQTQVHNIQRVCTECEEELQRQPIEEEEEEEVLQSKKTLGYSPEVTSDLESAIYAKRGEGQPLPESSRSFFEPRFGHDFSNVRVHTGSESDSLNRSLNARAFTTGRDIFFRKGEYNPGSFSGQELLAHELTHVVQQNAYRGPTISRQKVKQKPSQVKKKNLYFVIGDSKLNVGGGVFLNDLETLRTELLKTSLTGDWTLTITIHGAETFFGLSAGDVTGGLTENDPKAYNKSKVKKIFGDKKFQTWRKEHGPMRINLLSCQIGNELEDTFLKLVQHPTSKQRPVGLGQGCILYNTAVEATINDKHIKTRKQYDALSEPDQEKVRKTLTELNDKYGYNGNKIKQADILNYYFDVAPEGLWITVNVRTKKGKLIPFLGRQSNTTFITECDPKSLRQRQPRVPRAPDEE